MMGRYCNCCPLLRRPYTKKIALLLVGLDNAGKTTAARGLAGGVSNDAIPTVGFTAIKLKHRGMEVSIYDLGGGSQIRAIWKSYFSDVHGVIFVVDASDVSRIEECKHVLENLLRDEKLAGKPVLVLANKQDKPGALDQVDIVESLRLEPLVNEQKCLTLIEECSAVHQANQNKIDARLLSGYRWLINQISNDYEILNKRVEFDKKKEAEKFEAHRKALRQRLDIDKENGVLQTSLNGGPSNLPYDSKIIHVSPPPGVSDEGISHDVDQPDVSDTEELNEESEIQNLTKHIKEQLERHHSKEKNKLSLGKRNKITPTNFTNNGKNFLDEIPGTSRKSFPSMHFESDSLMLQALTSPVGKRDAKQNLPPLRMPGKLRPATSKSLGNEGMAWDLDKELEIVEPNAVFGKNSELSKVRTFGDIDIS